MSEERTNESLVSFSSRVRLFFSCPNPATLVRFWMVVENVCGCASYICRIYASSNRGGMDTVLYDGRCWRIHPCGEFHLICFTNNVILRIMMVHILQCHYIRPHVHESNGTTAWIITPFGTPRCMSCQNGMSAGLRPRQCANALVLCPIQFVRNSLFI